MQQAVDHENRNHLSLGKSLWDPWELSAAQNVTTFSHHLSYHRLAASTLESLCSALSPRSLTVFKAPKMYLQLPRGAGEGREQGREHSTHGGTS